METVMQIRTNLDELEFGFWDEGQQEFVPIHVDEKFDSETLKKLGGSLELLDALCLLVENLKSCLSRDLHDIWKRLDEAGL